MGKTWYAVRDCAGKDVLNSFREVIQSKYGITLTDYRIIDEFKSEEVPSDLLDLLRSLDDYRHQKRTNREAETDVVG